MNVISSEMAAPGSPNLHVEPEGMSEIVLAQEFFNPSMLKKLTFAEPRMLKLGWWGGQIATRCVILFKKPN